MIKDTQQKEVNLLLVIVWALEEKEQEYPTKAHILRQEENLWTISLS